MTTQPTRRRPSLGITVRMALLGVVVAVVVALVAGIAAFPLVRDSAQSRAGADLARLAELTATTVTKDPQGQFVVPPRVGVVLQTEGVSAYVVFRGVDEPPPGTTQRDIDLVTTGRPVSGTGSTEDGDVLVEGRPLDRGPLGRGTGVLLVQPVSVAIGPALAVLWRVAAALALGIVVAIVVAVIVSQRMARSLRAVATAADRLGRGERDVVVNAAGPAEVTQIAESINRLSQALTESEGRQRDFLLSVSHELRTPLTAVMGYAQAISDGLVESPDLSRTGAVMVTEAQRLDRLVSDLLDLARLQAVDFSFNLVEVDVRDIVVQAYDVWRDRCQRVGVDLQVTGIDSSVIDSCVIDEDRSDEGFSDAGFIVAVDPLRLRQIIDNLTENALRVTPEGGRIVFALTRLPDSLTLEVRDTGPGLTEEDIAVAFTPGALHGRYHGVRPVGTGVGLALVARLARGLGGTALAAQAPEGGARFTVVLPISAGRAG
mgnify:CR=1 FL=1